MKSFVVTFYDRFKWIVEGNDTTHARKKCELYYPDRIVTSLVEVPQGFKL